MTVILAIDPATVKVGYGLIKCTGQDIRLLDWGRWTLKGEIPSRLAGLHCHVMEYLAEHKPDLVAVEDLKFNRGTPNLSSMTKVAFAIGTVQTVYALNKYTTVHSLTANSVRKTWDVEQKKANLREAINKRFLLQLQDQGRPHGFKPSDEDITDAIGLAVAVWATQNSNKKHKKHAK